MMLTHSKMTFQFFLAFAIAVSAVTAVPYVAKARTDAWWTHIHDSNLAKTKAHLTEEKVIFLGDDLIAGWGFNGLAVWDAQYRPRGAFLYGINADATEHVLYRVGTEFEGVNPKLVILQVGTHNLPFNSVNDIAKGIQGILDALHTKLPNAKVLLLSILPQPTEKLDTKVHDVNKLIQRFADQKRVHYFDLAVHFEMSVGHEIDELYTADHKHLSEKGYQLWYKLMEPSFKELTA